MDQQWNFLENSYWFVPATSLPAIQMSADSTQPTQMIDQTVWQITSYAYGYFWGNCAVLLYEKGTTPGDAPTALRLVGTVTPEGSVQIAFMPINPIGAAMSTSGFGRMKERNGQWNFEMQMSSGITELVAHWAFMELTQEGELSWHKLPGTDYSVPEFLKTAGFSV